MELREFAESVLFGKTLAEKLHSPDSITDAQPGSAIAAPPAPGRPAELRFKDRGERRGEFPGGHRLSNSTDRGRLLHFFANHELLATELMALVLLRFPDAPVSFRKGVLRTLRDEQEHTRLYLQRMNECGVQFGELPVSGYFWRAISGMESPMDYVAGLSLTFEQANLDFARQFSDTFKEAGDDATGKLLERIYKDEIAHVAYGLKWFRRWKDPKIDDWEAFRLQLKFPLSPSRARGGILNAEGRRAAGFDEKFIAELEVHAQSRGRTPNVFLFNPFAEAYISQGKSFTPVKAQFLLADDLSGLPQFLCREDDIVLVPRKPAVPFLAELKQAGFSPPEFIQLQAGRIGPASKLDQRKLGALRPWAWSPDSLEVLQPLLKNVTIEKRAAGELYNPALAQLYSKSWSAAFLGRVLERFGKQPWLCTVADVGVTVKDMDAALVAIEDVRGRGHHKVVVKAALGLAGSNAIRLWEPEVLEKHKQWMSRNLEHGELVIERWLERTVDFSAQLQMETKGLRLCGYTGLMNDLKGQFEGNWAEANYSRSMPRAVTRLFALSPGTVQSIQEFCAQLFDLLQDELATVGFRGPIGIDAFAYRTAEGEVRLKPVVEINPRYTMGRLTLELMRQACPGSTGLFRLVGLQSATKDGHAGFSEYVRDLKKRFPLRLEGSPSARIREGMVCLNDPDQAQKCLALFQVARTMQYPPHSW